MLDAEIDRLTWLRFSDPTPSFITLRTRVCQRSAMDTLREWYTKETVEEVGGVLNDPKRLLLERFRALFTLRGIASHEAISQIGRCLNDSSALLKHECAYCLGQIQDPYAIPLLRDVLEDTNQEPMVCMCAHEDAKSLVSTMATGGHDLHQAALGGESMLLTPTTFS